MDTSRKIVVNQCGRSQRRNRPTVLYGRAARFVPGGGRNIRGRYSQTEEEILKAVSEDQEHASSALPTTAASTCAIALEKAETKLQDLQRHHRERWVQHHLYMRRTAVWEEEVQQSTRSLRDAFLNLSKNIKAACQAKPSTAPSSDTAVPSKHSPIVPPESPCPPAALEHPHSPSPSRSPVARSEPGSESAESYVCLAEDQLDAWANAVWDDFDKEF